MTSATLPPCSRISSWWAKYTKPDIAFVPIGGRANMNINPALVAARWLGAEGIVVPIHYDLYTEGSVDPFEFKSKLESTTNIQCMVMRP